MLATRALRLQTRSAATRLAFRQQRAHLNPHHSFALTRTMATSLDDPARASGPLSDKIKEDHREVCSP